MPGLTDTSVPAIAADGLTARFGDLVAVDRLSLEVPAGSIFGFLGPNGAGKTTTIRLLLGLVLPAAGRATVGGHDVATDGTAVRRACGVLLEHAGLYERLSAHENLRFFGRLWHLDPDRLEGRITELLAHFGLAGRTGEPVGTWSRGMKQKVALARAFLAGPKVLFLDEPTAGLDPVSAVALRDDLVHLASAEGVTVFITTHNLDEAERLCDLVGVIRGGRLLTVGPPGSLRAGAGIPLVVIAGRRLAGSIDQLRSLPGVRSVGGNDSRLEVELADDGVAAPLVRVLVESGAEVEEVVRAAPSLEKAFLRLLGEGEPAPGDER